MKKISIISIRYLITIKIIVEFNFIILCLYYAAFLIHTLIVDSRWRRIPIIVFDEAHKLKLLNDRDAL